MPTLSSNQVQDLPTLVQFLTELGLDAKHVVDTEMPEWSHVLTECDMKVYRLAVTTGPAPGVYWVLEWKGYARQFFATLERTLSAMLGILDVDLRASYVRSDKLVRMTNNIRRKLQNA